MWKITSEASAPTGWLRYDESTMKALVPGTIVLFDTGDRPETKKWVSHFIDDYKGERYNVAEIRHSWGNDDAYEIRFRKSVDEDEATGKDVIVDPSDLLITDPTSFTDIK